MSRIQQDVEELKKRFGEQLGVRQLPSGAYLIEILNYKLPNGWDRERGDIIFVAPPAFPAAQPDCFWVAPVGLRFGGGRTPQSSNDSNPVPELGTCPGTWFSWHLQEWDPNKHTLISFLKVIEKRLDPPR